MEIGILTTVGGPHPADKWAAVTAKQIIQIASHSQSALLREAIEFEAKLLTLLTEFHDRVQCEDRDALDKHGTEHLDTEISTKAHLSDAVKAVVGLARGTGLAEHFAKPETQAYLAQVLHEHFHHSIWIERSWHADRNNKHPAAKAFKARALSGIGAYAGNAQMED